MTTQTIQPDISLWRFAVAIVAIIPALLLNGQDVFMMTQIMGPSHAILAFLAQRKAGQWRDTRKNTFFIALFGLAVIAGFFIPLHFIFFVSAFFVLHNFLDDIVLFNTVPNGRTQLLGAYAFLVFFLINVDSMYNLHILRDNLPVISLGLIGCLAAMMGQTKTPQFTYLVYISAHAFVMLTLTYLVAPGRLQVENVFCFIVVCHYLNWYIYIYKKKKIRGNTVDTRRYVRDCLVSNAFFVSLYIVCRYLVNFDNLVGISAAIVFVGVFDVIAFNIFTFMHLATTVRPSDYAPQRFKPA